MQNDLIGQLRDMEFKEVLEQEAVYYLAEVAVNNGETFKFTMDICDFLFPTVISFPMSCGIQFADNRVPSLSANL